MAAALLWSVIASGWWILALAPLSSLSPEWLLRAREVCFGSMPRGLPEAQGWIMLTAPIPIGVGVWLLWGEQLRRTRVTVLLLIASLPLTTLVWGTLRLERGFRAEQAANQSGPDQGPLPPEYPRLNLPLPLLHLTDLEGHRVEASWFQGRTTLLTFAFIHCQTVCPALLENLTSTGLRLAVITLDPWRDTCGTLPESSRKWRLPPDAVVLSGDNAEVNRVLDALKVTRTRDPRTGDITHPPLVYVVDSQARLAYAFLNPSSGWLKEAVRRVESGE